MKAYTIPPEPQEKNVRLDMTAQEAKLLNHIAGFNKTIPELFSLPGEHDAVYNLLGAIRAALANKEDF